MAVGGADLTFHGGPVLHTTKTYAIFWLPPGAHFEAPGHGSDAQFERLVEQFLADVGGTPYYNLATQYSDDLGRIENQSRFAAAAVDTQPYPADTSAIGGEVVRVAQQHHWLAGLTVVFLVFTAPGAFHAFDLHSDVDANGSNYVFAALMNPYVCTSCDASGYDAVGIASPNRDTTFDLMTRSLSHEMFEAITDPLGVSWYDATIGPDGGEIADKCQGALVKGGDDGANVSLHGHRYAVASLWSNEVQTCALSLGPTEPARGSVSSRTRSAAARHGRYAMRP